MSTWRPILSVLAVKVVTEKHGIASTDHSKFSETLYRTVFPAHLNFRVPGDSILGAAAVEVATEKHGATISFFCIFKREKRRIAFSILLVWRLTAPWVEIFRKFNFAKLGDRP